MTTALLHARFLFPDFLQEATIKDPRGKINNSSGHFSKVSNSHKIIVGDLITALSPIDKSTGLKLDNHILALKIEMEISGLV